MYSLPLWYELPVLILCLSLIDAIRRVIAQNSLSEAEYSQYMPKQLKSSVDIHTYSIGMFSYPYIPKGHFHLKIAFFCWKQQYPSQIQDLTVLDVIQMHSIIYCLYISSVSIQASFPYHLYNHLPNILWSDTVRWCLPIQQLRDLSALIFCVLPVLEMMCQSKHFMLNMGPALCCFSFRVGLSTKHGMRWWSSIHMAAYFGW